MISKLHRLNEREVRKVLSKRKPFFSYTLVANVIPNTLGYARCGILLSGKQTKGSVNRNSFRRIFYDVSRGYLQKTSSDIVVVVKKGTVFNRKDLKQIEEFKRDLIFLWNTITKKKNP
ncbi:MAG: ribonuclease P protein component [Candidatus Gracilibacteria bacterium]|nr:ribonuclease P protein component [Candidatus Gracilibacteria bacterium]